MQRRRRRGRRVPRLASSPSTESYRSILAELARHRGDVAFVLLEQRDEIRRRGAGAARRPRRGLWTLGRGLVDRRGGSRVAVVAHALTDELREMCRLEPRAVRDGHRSSRRHHRPRHRAQDPRRCPAPRASAAAPRRRQQHGRPTHHVAPPPSCDAESDVHEHRRHREEGQDPAEHFQGHPHFNREAPAVRPAIRRRRRATGGSFKSAAAAVARFFAR